MASNPYPESGHRRPDLVFWIPPDLLDHDICQNIHGIPHIHISEVKRRESKAQDIRGAEITDHVPFDQGLHDGITVWVGQRHLAAARFCIAGTGDTKTVFNAFLRYQGNDAIQTEYIQGLRNLMKAWNTTIWLYQQFVDLFYKLLEAHSKKVFWAERIPSARRVVQLQLHKHSYAHQREQ